MHKDNWLEQLDTQHRYGYYLQPFYDQWKCEQKINEHGELGDTAKLEFFEWLDKAGPRPPAEILKTDKPPKSVTKMALDSARLVWCATPAERAPHQIKVVRGKLYVASTDPDWSSQTLSTKASAVFEHYRPKPMMQLSTKHDGVKPVDFVFVVGRDGKLYGGDKCKPSDDGKTKWTQRGFFHSSLLGGAEVKAAGKFEVTDGQLLAIKPESGHYKPEVEHIDFLLEMLRSGGVALEGVRIQKPSKWDGVWPMEDDVWTADKWNPEKTL